MNSDWRERIEDLVYREAELLDDRQFAEWLSLFTREGIYWLPIDEQAPRPASASLIYDDALAREERVHHLQQLSFPAQSPPSRTVHLVGNLHARQQGEGWQARTSQVIYEIRGGDYTQAGLGQATGHVARVDYALALEDGQLKIAMKKVLLINRDMPLGNLTFIL